MPLSKFHKSIIDATLEDLLLTLHEKPDEAVEALSDLCQVKMISKQEKSYPDLPEKFYEARFSAIREAIQALHKIMLNPQPEEPIRDPTKTHADDPRPEAAFGIFGLTNRPNHRESKEETVNSKEVREYLIEQFQKRIWVIWNLRTVLDTLRDWKAEHKNQYYKAFATGIQEQTMPDEMKQIIQAAGEHFIFQAEDLLTAAHYKTALERGMNDIATLPPDQLDKKLAHTFETFFNAPAIPEEKNTPDQHKPVAINVAKEKLTKQIGDDAFVHLEDVLTSFNLVHQASQLICAHHPLLGQEGEHGYTHEHIRIIERLCTRYIRHINKQPADQQQPLSELKRKILTLFIEKTNLYLKKSTQQQNQENWVANFFGRVFASTSESQHTLYVTLIHFAFSQRTIFVNDSWIKATRHQYRNRETNTIDLKPYHVNRIILHACLTLPKNWSDDFYKIFQEVLDLLEKLNAGDDVLGETFKKSSYPAQFIKQLRWLSQQHSANNAVAPLEEKAQADAAEASATFPLLYFPKTAGQFSALLSILPVELFLKVLKSVTHSPFNPIQTAEDFKQTLAALSVERRTVVFHNLSDRLSTLIHSTEDLVDVLNYLSPKQGYSSSEPQAIVIDTLYNQLPKLIKTMSQLTHVLTHLHPAQHAVVIEKMRDRLSTLAETEHHLLALFMHLDKAQHAVVIRTLFGQLRTLIKTPAIQELILEHLSEDQHLTLVRAIEMKPNKRGANLCWASLCSAQPPMVSLRAARSASRTTSPQGLSIKT